MFSYQKTPLVFFKKKKPTKKIIPHLLTLRFSNNQAAVVEEVKYVVQRSVPRRGRRANRDLVSLGGWNCFRGVELRAI